MVKIAYFITDLGLGGAEKMLLAMLTRLNKKRYSCIVYCFYAGELLSQIEQLNIKVVDLKIKNKADFFAFLKLYYYLLRDKPHILHSHLFHANIIGRVIAKLAGVPIIISTQHHSVSFHGRIGMFADKITSYFADCIITVSQAAKAFCVTREGISEKKIRNVYNGIDCESIPLDKTVQAIRKQLLLGEGPLIGSIGRFVEVKGYAYLIKAAYDIFKRYSHARLLLLGYGPLKDELMELAEKLKINDKILFFSQETIKVADFLSALDIFILPSLSEGLSITLLEAMAASRPIIATDVGGNSEVISDKNTGLLILPKKPTAISEAVSYLLENSNFAARIAQNARAKVVSTFNIKNMITGIESIYEDFLIKKNL